MTIPIPNSARSFLRTTKAVTCPQKCNSSLFPLSLSLSSHASTRDSIPHLKTTISTRPRRETIQDKNIGFDHKFELRSATRRDAQGPHVDIRALFHFLLLILIVLSVGRRLDYDPSLELSFFHSGDHPQGFSIPFCPVSPSLSLFILIIKIKRRTILFRDLQPRQDREPDTQSTC